MNNSENTILGILALILGLGILGLVIYGLVKLVLWIIRQWKFINERCVINHKGFRPLSIFRQFLTFFATAACCAGIFLAFEGLGSHQPAPDFFSAELGHAGIVFLSGLLLLAVVFFWIRARANGGVAFYTVLLMILVSFLLLLAILLAFLSFAGKNQSNQGSNPANSSGDNPRTIGTVVQSSPNRVTIYDDQGNLIRTLNGVLESYTPTIVNLRQSYNSNLVQAFDVNGNLKYSRVR